MGSSIAGSSTRSAGRGYPQDVVEAYGQDMPYIQPGDMTVIAAPVDFVGVNYYFRNIIRSEAVPERKRAAHPLPERQSIPTWAGKCAPRGCMSC